MNELCQFVEVDIFLTSGPLDLEPFFRYTISISCADLSDDGCVMFHY